VIPQDLSRFGFLIVMVDPGLLSPGVDFQAQVAEYVKWVQSAQPIDPQQPVRMPFERSARDRARRLQEGVIEVPETIHASLQQLAA
jgi:LDH2 family malate/lactate/ureidoglycolate dehydrogenase